MVKYNTSSLCAIYCNFLYHIGLLIMRPLYPFAGKLVVVRRTSNLIAGMGPNRSIKIFNWG